MARLRSLSRQHFGVRNRSPWWQILAHTFHQFHENDLFTSAAAMSYFGLLTLFPALLILLAIGNWMTAGTELMSRLLQVFPASADFLRSTVRSLSDVGPWVILSCVVVLLWAGSWVFTVVERALNRIWQTSPRTFLHGRAITLAMIGLVGLVLSASILLTSVLVWTEQFVSRLSPRQWTVLLSISSAFWQLILAGASAMITIVIFLLVYRFMPNTKVYFHDALPGAVVGGLLWELAKYVFAWSLQYFHYDQIYGSVGTVVAVLTWGYVSSLILLFGAQLTAICHKEHPVKVPLSKVESVDEDAETAPLPDNVVPLKSLSHRG
jgi:YihY family inner membrane protein